MKSEEAGGARKFLRRSPHANALALWVLSLLLFWQPLSGLARLSFQDELASHVLLIPVISGFLFFLERKQIFRATSSRPPVGILSLVAAAALWYSLQSPLRALNGQDRLSVAAALIVCAWLSVFVFCYGARSFRSALFPLLFLFLMIPLPAGAVERATVLLQKGSADVCFGLFRAVGVPVIRHGFQFSLPGVDIEVAEQCSGIHSALSLFIAGLLAEHFLLNGFFKKICFTALIFPIAIFKNAVRIVTIAWLGIHVDPAFFTGELHHHSGVPFSLLALFLMGVALWCLRLRASNPRTHESIRAQSPGFSLN